MTPEQRARHAKLARVRRRNDPESSRAASRRYYKKNCDKLRAENRAWKRTHRAEIRVYDRRWLAKNPSYFRDYQRVRRVKIAWLTWTRVLAQGRGFA